MQRRIEFEDISNRLLHKPYPHQEKAVQAILETFKTHERTHAIMACGTGKTHVCLWVAERLNAKRIVVFVPSLALIHQLLHEWMANTSWDPKNVSCMAVCSDPGVAEGLDIFRLDPSECNFPVSTSSVEVHRFLKKKISDKQAVRIVLCTYHSAHVLAAGISGCDPFDLSIFDEAHRTTGIYDRNFSIPLSDKNVPAKKRLFVTATPKHYDIHRRNKEGESKLVYSMDSKKHYGPRAYTLSFRQAVNLNIISDYRILIPIIITDTLHKRSKNLGENLDEKIVALQKSVEQHDISKIITFHQSISDAKTFSYYLNQSQELDEYGCFHVNCMMPVSNRNEIMSNFRNQQKTLISNARCLTEGTNIPAVDMVAFFNQKRSKIDIVQAIGRVMRKHENKKKGYVFVPLYVQLMKGESVEDSVYRAHFEEVWEVLQALAEQDEDLHQTIQFLKINRGKKILLDFKKLNRFVEIIPNIKLDFPFQRQLKNAISIAIVDKIGEFWDEMYGRLIAYKEKNGNCNVSCDDLDTSLKVWVDNQRRLYKIQTLSNEKIIKLDKLEFNWRPNEAKWDLQYQKLLKYKKKYGDCNVPQWDVRYRSLAFWVKLQRMSYRKGMLEKDKIIKLDKLKFNWNPIETQWNLQYKKLLEFRRKNGHCDVPPRYSKDKTLGFWVNAQRRLYKIRTLSKEKIIKLDKLKFNWNPVESQWNLQYQKLLKYKKRHGDCLVPSRYERDKSLPSWVMHQRQFYKKGM